MHEGLAVLERPRHRGGVLLDSNLLLLYLVGLYDPRLIRTFKRTTRFRDADFLLLVDLMRPFAARVTTPHVLAEVNGLANALPERLKGNFRLTLRAELSTWTEHHHPAARLVADPVFVQLGLTDAAVAAEGQAGTVVLTTDAALVRWIRARGGAADDFGVIQAIAGPG